jgi:hypothetical protein
MARSSAQLESIDFVIVDPPGLECCGQTARDVISAPPAIVRTERRFRTTRPAPPDTVGCSFLLTRQDFSEVQVIVPWIPSWCQ